MRTYFTTLDGMRCGISPEVILIENKDGSTIQTHAGTIRVVETFDELVEGLFPDPLKELTHP